MLSLITVKKFLAHVTLFTFVRTQQMESILIASFMMKCYGNHDAAAIKYPLETELFPFSRISNDHFTSSVVVVR